MANITSYYEFPKYVANGTIDLDTSAVYASLHTSAYTPSRSHTVGSSISGSEVSHAGYTAGGVVLSGKTVALSGTDTKWSATIPAITPTGTSMACRYMILRKGSGAIVAGDELIGYIDLGAQTISAGYTLTVAFTNGIFSILPGA